MERPQSPNRLIYAAMHQDYSSDYVGEVDLRIAEDDAGRTVVSRLLSGERGHYGPLEHPTMSVAAGYFPHSVMQQLRTHRIWSFDVQSFRFTGMHLAELGQAVDALASTYPGPGLMPASLLSEPLQESLERAVYLRPPGLYPGLEGGQYHYSKANRDADLADAMYLLWRYYQKTSLQKMAAEQARGVVPFDVRQHFVFTGSLRSWLHLMAIRGKADAQLECRMLCALAEPLLAEWVPEIWSWFENHHKGFLAP